MITVFARFKAHENKRDNELIFINEATSLRSFIIIIRIHI